MRQILQFITLVITVVTTLALLTTILTACGQSGPLVLPKETPIAGPDTQNSRK